MAEFVNASPKIVFRGTEDNSTRTVLPERDPLPQHLPLFYIFAQKGSTKRIVTAPAKLVSLYGAASFELDEKYYNHQTRFLSLVSGTGNTVMVQRLVPEDAKKANAIVYLDIIKDDNIPNYVRRSDGSLVSNETNTAYLVDKNKPTISGYKIKWIKEVVDASTTDFATAEVKTGTMVRKSGVPGEPDRTSTMYPIFEIRAAEVGEAYNNLGFSVNVIPKDAQNTKLITTLNSMMYTLSLYERASAKDVPTVKRSLFGETGVNFVFKEKARNPDTEAVMDIETVYDNNWFNETDALKPLVYKDFEGLYFYRENYEKVLKLLLAAEAPFISDVPQMWADNEDASTLSWYDYTTADQELLMDQFGLLNPFTLRSVRGTRYISVAVDTGTPNLKANQTEISMTSSTPIFLSGGSDGTLSNENFEKEVCKKMDEYLDENSEVMDTAINVESIFYDSGFSLDTKKELTSFISLRKDTFLMLTTHVDSLGTKYRPLSEERAIAVALKTRLKLVPESTYYGTPVCRAIVSAGSGKFTDGSTNTRIPLLYNIAKKAAKMMGAGNGKWKPKEIFDTAPNNIIDDLTDIQPYFIPEGIKPTLWNEGMIWAQPYDRSSYHFPAMQTVYDNDTSVLNSFFTAMALCTLTKIGADSWRNFTGSTKLTDAQFVDKVTAYLNSRTEGIFADMFVIVHDVVITEHDEQLGYVWHTTSKIYANNMKTVCVFNPAAYRMSDLGNK